MTSFGQLIQGDDTIEYWLLKMLNRSDMFLGDNKSEDSILSFIISDMINSL